MELTGGKLGQARGKVALPAFGLPHQRIEDLGQHHRSGRAETGDTQESAELRLPWNVLAHSHHPPVFDLSFHSFLDQDRIQDEGHVTRALEARAQDVGMEENIRVQAEEITSGHFLPSCPERVKVVGRFVLGIVNRTDSSSVPLTDVLGTVAGDH